MAIVELKNVVKNYGGRKAQGPNAVDDFNLTTRDGEFVVLVGPSGCGKTTTMRMIAGLEDLSAGSIRIGGRDVSDVAPRDRDIAMVFQSYALYPHMTVFGNMAFALRLKKLPQAEIEKRVREAARMLDIEHLLERKPRALSGGQRQRVALGRAIVRQPQVFLMDEPLSNLDAKLRVETRAQIIKLHRSLGVTTFYVTHDQVEAMTMGQRIVVMLDGNVQQIATPHELYAQPVNTFVAGFIGTPSMNFLPATVGDDARSLQGEGYRFRAGDARAAGLAGKAGATVLVGVRPEHLKWCGSGDAQAANHLAGKVDVVEPLGSTTMVQVDVGGQRITAQLDSAIAVEMGQPIALTCAADVLHLFDAQTGQALGLPAQA
ncbi:ABC transporter ATP-binding protein [Frateuria defendens]|uniref:ABC transporter ATP-binding protein n=1 Tax=Frateuria defendens TaxID=2219559 RepID=UPI00066FBD69|nr:sn-glycerol-3-phosphate ABC transporter ATP-binding protein UgpC [Frateuria defendens]